MKKAILGMAIVAAGLLTTTSASAASFSVNFCPGDATCPAGITEASLRFDEIAGGDPNDYDLFITITGNGAVGEPQMVDMVSFSIDGVATPGGYASKPSLVGATPATTPLDGSVGSWGVFYDNINNEAACQSDSGSAQEVCVNSLNASNPGATIGTNTLTWHLFVDLAAGESPLAVGSSANLRVHFVSGCTWEDKNAGKPNKPADFELKCNGAGNTNLSPGGGTLETGTNETSTNETSTNETSTNETSTNETGRSVPEPALMSLLGLGLVGVARQVRRRR